MIGIPSNLQSRADWLNAYQYAQDHPQARPTLKARLEALKASGTMKVLRPGVAKPPEEQTPDDYEDVLDPASPLVLSGLLLTEIETMIRAL
jgi:hypothetical protein